MKRIWIFPSLSMSSAVSVTSCEMALAVFGCWVNEGSGDTLRGICVSVRLMRAVLLPRVGSNRSELPETRSEEHTSELQSQSNLVCRLLLEKKKKKHITSISARRRTHRSR